MASKFDHIFEFFERTAEQYFSEEELRKKLRSGKKLRIKYGVDVTAPTLHIGHAVNMWLMRYLQDLGHKVIFLIGDYTTRIGDPTGRSELRPLLSKQDIDRNAEAFIEQAKMILRFDKPDLFEIRRNSEWYDKMPLQEMMDLLSMVTHARLVSRDMFQLRIAEGKDIHMHEMLYPVLQGWDSVMLDSDLTIIGSDQLFNEMMGRFFQEKKGKKPQTIVTTKITPGIDGKGKQSKSVGNYIGLGHSPRDKFGRVMSIPDNLIDTYFRVYTDVPLDGIEMMQQEIADKPREAKLKLAYAIVGRYHGHEIAFGEKQWFIDTFSKRKVPDDIPVLTVYENRMNVLELVSLARKNLSKSECRRLIKQGAVELNGEKFSKAEEEIVVSTNDILKIGKRNWYKIHVVSLNELETEHLWMKPATVEDIDFLQKYIPDWEMAKYLGRAPMSKKAVQELVFEAFKKVIASKEPKKEWLWAITDKRNPDAPIGLAHLRKDSKLGNENIWIVKDHRGQGYMQEAMDAISEHAFTALGFDALVFKNAFSHAAIPQEIDTAFRYFMSIDPTFQNRDDPTGFWGFTKEGWELVKERIESYAPSGRATASFVRKKEKEARKQQKITEKTLLSNMAAQFQMKEAALRKEAEKEAELASKSPAMGPRKPKPGNNLDQS